MSISCTALSSLRDTHRRFHNDRNGRRCGHARSSTRAGVYDPSKDLSFSLEDELNDPESNITPPPPPTEGRFEIHVTKEMIRSLDLTVAHQVLRPFVAQIGDNTSPPLSDPSPLLTRRLGFTIKYERDDPIDPRELSELPDVRLWFVRLDAAYPWLPAVLDWRAGELGRYAAMLVPHQMSKRMGLVFNPEAVELWTMNKAFIIHAWLVARGDPRPDVRVKDMAKCLGFSLSDALFSLLNNTPQV